LQGLQECDSDPVSFLLSYPYLTAAEKKRMLQANIPAFEKAIARSAFILTKDDYPEPLNHCPFAPPALFGRGVNDVLEKKKIGIVGTRKATSYGKGIAKRFAERIIKAGAVVVSGGAYGIDAAAHQSALDAGGTTIAVLPTGIDQYYPVVHAPLFDRICQNGCLLSPYAVASKWHAGRPVLRNYVLASLLDALVVIEAPHRSGALMTAGFANELGKEVFVVPANIDHPNFKGSHHLIREGAILVDDPVQVLDALGLALTTEKQEFLPKRTLKLSQVRQNILDLLRMGPMDSEKLGEHLNESPSTLLSELTMLEMEGLIYRDIGGYVLQG
jgi:DNA processing protein